MTVVYKDKSQAYCNWKIAKEQIPSIQLTIQWNVLQWRHSIAALRHSTDLFDLWFIIIGDDSNWFVAVHTKWYDSLDVHMYANNTADSELFLNALPYTVSAG